MHRKIFYGVIILAVLTFVVSLLIPVPIGDSQNEQAAAQYLPWQIEDTTEGSIRVFGLSLGQSTLREAEQLYHGGAEVSLFVSPQGRHRVEAYFDKVVLGGFSAQMVLVMDLAQEQLAAMYQRGARVSHMGGDRKKVTLAPDDLQRVFDSPVGSIAYLTRARLDDELLRKRFGEPAQRIREADSQTTH